MTNIRSSGAVVLIIAAAVLTARAQTGTAKTTTGDEEGKAAWERFLAGSMRGAEPLMLEYEAGERPPTVALGEGPSPEKLAAVLGRECVRMGGVAVLRRRSTSEAASAFGSLRVLDWIGKLSDGDRKALFDRGLPGDRLEPDIAEALARASGASASFIRGEMVAKPFVVRLGFTVQADYPTGDRTAHASWGLPWTGLGLARADAPKPRPLGGLEPSEARKPASAGPLGWSEGKIAALPALLSEVRRTSKTRYVVDERQKDELLFVRGRMTVADFDAALAKLTEVGPVMPLRGEALARSRFERMLSKELAPEFAAAGARYDLAEVRGGGTVTADDLARTFPGLKSRMESQGFKGSVPGQVRLGLCGFVNVSDGPGRVMSYETGPLP